MYSDILTRSMMLLTEVRAVSNASEDILRNDAMWRTSMDSISWLTDIIDAGFATFISVVGLLIISSALLKNVIAAAYASNHKLWDSVDQAHRMLQLNSQFRQSIQNVMSGQALDNGYWEGEEQSGIKMLFLRCLPNIKRMSDLNDPTIRPVTYFLKAIPQMFAVVYLGIFIWNGYYRELAAVAGDTAAIYTERILLDTDPISLIDKMMNTASSPSFESDMGVGGYATQRSKLSKQIYSMIVSKYSDIKGKEVKDQLAYEIEQTVGALLSADQKGVPGMMDNAGNPVSGDDLFNDDKYGMTLNLQWISGTPEYAGRTITDSTEGVTTVEYREDQDKRTASGLEEFLRYHTIGNVKETFGFDSLIAPDEINNLRVTIKYSRKTEQKIRASGNLQLTAVTTSSPTGLSTNAGNGIVFKLPDNVNYTMSGSTSVNHTGYKIDYLLDSDNSKLTLKVTRLEGNTTPRAEIPWNEVPSIKMNIVSKTDSNMKGRIATTIFAGTGTPSIIDMDKGGTAWPSSASSTTSEPEHIGFIDSDLILGHIEFDTIKREQSLS